MDASDSGLCTSDQHRKQYVRFDFESAELEAVANFKRTGGKDGFNINVRELLSCLFATIVWAEHWASLSSSHHPFHIQFIIDNTSAVAWTTKLASRNTMAQTIIRYRAAFEIGYNLVFSARHIAGKLNLFDDAGSRATSSPAAETHFTNLSRDFLQVAIPLQWRQICALSNWKRATDPFHAARLKHIVQQ